MYRMRQLFTLSDIDAWNEAMTIVEEVNKLCASKDWVQATVYERTVGRFGEMSLEMDYPDLATWSASTRSGCGTRDRQVMRRIDAIATVDLGYTDYGARHPTS